MTIINLIKTSIYSMKSHKLRVFLTMIGIIIGISSVVTILSVGNGLKAEVNKSIEDTSSNKINVYFESENISMDTTLIEPFDKSDIYDIQNIEGVQKVEEAQSAFGGLDFSMAQTSYFDKTVTIFLSPYGETKLNVQYGRDFKDGESSKNRIILNKLNAEDLFEKPENAIGKGVSINNDVYEVIGVLGDESAFSLVSGVSYVSEEAMSEMNVSTTISSIDVYIEPNADKETVFADVKELLALNHASLEGEYAMQDPEAITKAFEKIIGGLTSFIAVVSGISLFVGGIGVMNIMYVSVTERKREIGIRRAIGAKPRSILLQFLFEAILVTGIGGLVGIFFGFLFGKIAGVFLPFEPVLTFGSFAGATLTSVIVGIVFGIIPAYNASKLDPIKAIYR